MKTLFPSIKEPFGGVGAYASQGAVMVVPVIVDDVVC